MQNEIWEFPTVHNGKTVFNVLVTEHWHRLTERGCGVSLIGSVQKLSGHGPGQVALDGSAFESGVGSDDLQGSHQTSTILLFFIILFAFKLFHKSFSVVVHILSLFVNSHSAFYL